MKIITFIATIGALQGFIILLSIMFKFKHQKNMPLALLLIVFSSRLVTIPTWDPDILLRYPFLLPLTTPLPFLFGPFLWWYIKELVSDTLNTPKPLYIHFLPYIFEVSALIFTLLTKSNIEYELFINNVFSGNPPLWLPVRNALKVIINMIYIIFASRMVFSKKAARLSEAKRIWLRSLIIIPSLVLIFFAYVAVFPSVTKHLSDGSAAPFLVLSISMAVLIYGISFLLLIAPDVSNFCISRKKNKLDPLCSDDECKMLMLKIEKRFSDEAFRNPDLMLTDFASEFKVHQNRLSYAVNHCCGISFRTLLNTKRLDYFFSKVSIGALDNQSILELAFEAGFPSKSTFNRVFKEKYGLSPSLYIRQKAFKEII